MDDNRITKIVFFWDMNQYNSSRWTSQIKLLSASVIVIHIYNQLLLCDVDEFENKLVCNFENDGVLELNQLPKLRLYKNIKQNYR